jgi:hypothetical protein
MVCRHPVVSVAASCVEGIGDQLYRSQEGKYCTSLILFQHHFGNISHVQSHAFASCSCLPSRRHLITFTERPP